MNDGDGSRDKQALRLSVGAQMELGGASRRAREVAEMILSRGSCTTSDIEGLGYKHAPRAVRDLRDAGVNVERKMEPYEDPDTGNTKRRARYFIVGIDPSGRSRRAISKAFRDTVLAPGRCEVCGAPPPLQVDHRIPFSINGESYPHVASEFMPLCPSCNRSKSWACEHCPNQIEKDPEVCRTCLWASPDDYQHIATVQIRELRAVLEDLDDIALYDEFRPDLAEIVRAHLRDIPRSDN